MKNVKSLNLANKSQEMLIHKLKFKLGVLFLRRYIIGVVIRNAR